MNLMDELVDHKMEIVFFLIGKISIIEHDTIFVKRSYINCSDKLIGNKIS